MDHGRPAKLDFLFVYGTLHPDRAPQEIAPTARRLEFFAPATVQGRLRTLPDYPALKLDMAGSAVPGHLFRLPDPALLHLFDTYEGFLPGAPEDSLFVRVRTLARLTDGTERECWIYAYNGPLDARQ